MKLPFLLSIRKFFFFLGTSCQGFLLTYPRKPHLVPIMGARHAGSCSSRNKIPRYSSKRFTLENSPDAPDGERARARFCVYISYAVPPRLR